MTQWIKCSERLPEEFADILVCTEDSQVHEGYYFVYADNTPVWKVYCYSKLYANDAGIVTHWMPIPEPPTE